VWTYQYQTVGKGEAEVESYLTLSAPEMGHMKGNTSAEHQIELEIGMTDRFDFSIYQIFHQFPGEGIKYKGFKLRSRYKMGRKGEFLFDPLIYLEYKGKPDFSEHGVEFKLILTKDMGRFNLAFNPIFEFERGVGWEFEPEYAMGISGKVGELLQLGLEAKGNEYAHHLGPVISHGREDRWVTLGFGFKVAGAEDKEPEFQTRLLLGIGLK